MIKEIIKNKLRAECRKLVHEVKNEEYKSRIIKRNKFDERFTTFFGLTMLPIMIFIITTVITNGVGDMSAIANFISPQLLPVVITSGALGIGFVANTILEKKVFKLKSKLKEITNSKKQIDLLEEEMEHQINYQIAKNKVNTLKEVLENMDKKDSIISSLSSDYNISLDTNISIDDINKNIKQLELQLSNAFEELSISTKKQVLADRFWRCRDVDQSIIDMIMFPLMAAVGLTAYWNFLILMVSAIPNALNFILPMSLAEIIGTSYLLIKRKADKKVFNKLNNQLGDKALPKKRDYEKELKNEVSNKIKNVCEVYNELIHQQELLNVKKLEQSTDEKDKTISPIKKIVDGEPINKDPLDNIPEPIMSLYGISGNCFDTQEELKDFCKKNNYSMDDSYVLDYLGSVAGRSDVIRKTNTDGKTILYSVADEDGYGMYNHERSVYRGEYIWEYNYGQIRNLYKLFRDRGIVFNNDVYAKIDEYYKNLFNMMEDNELFGYKSIVEKEQTSNKVKKLSKENKFKKED